MKCTSATDSPLTAASSQDGCLHCSEQQKYEQQKHAIMVVFFISVTT
jgi:hypothetical protein